MGVGFASQHSLMPGEQSELLLKTLAPNCTSPEVQMTQPPDLPPAKTNQSKAISNIFIVREDWQLPGYQSDKYEVIVLLHGHGGRAFNCHQEV